MTTEFSKAFPGDSEPKQHELSSSQAEAISASYAAVIGHHGAMLKDFGVGFINLIALFNTGALFAAMAFVATASQKTQTTSAGAVPAPDDMATLIFWLFVLLGVAFVATLALKALFFFYSGKKFEEYRVKFHDVVAGRTKPVWPSSGLVKLSPAYGYAIGALFLMSLGASGGSLYIIFRIANTAI